MEHPHDTFLRIFCDEMQPLQFVDACSDGEMADAPCLHAPLDFGQAQRPLVVCCRFSKNGFNLMEGSEEWRRPVNFLWRRQDGHRCHMTYMCHLILVLLGQK